MRNGILIVIGVGLLLWGMSNGVAMAAEATAAKGSAGEERRVGAPGLQGTELSVAVYDFVEGNKKNGAAGKVVSAVVASALAGEKGLTVLERAELGKALTEQAFGVAGLVSTDAAAEIGQLTGAKVLVAGQVVRSSSRVIVIATIVGTETGRLFTARVEGPANRVVELSTELAGKIAGQIRAERANLIAAAGPSGSARDEEILRAIKGSKRPVVALNIHFPNDANQHSATAESELGGLLLKAGFTVVDLKAERRPDVEITGIIDVSVGRNHGGLFRGHGFLELKIQERRTGDILAIDRQESTAVGSSKVLVNALTQSGAAREIAIRLLPLLADMKNL